MSPLIVSSFICCVTPVEESDITVPTKLLVVFSCEQLLTGDIKTVIFSLIFEEH